MNDWAWWKLIGWRNEAIAPPACPQNHVDLSDYWKSGTWDIIEVPAYLNVHNDTGTFNFFPTTRPESPPPPPFRAEGISCLSCWGQGNFLGQNWPQQVEERDTLTARQTIPPPSTLLFDLILSLAAVQCTVHCSVQSSYYRVVCICNLGKVGLLRTGAHLFLIRNCFNVAK